MQSNSEIPSKLHLHKQSKSLEVVYPNGDRYTLSAEYCRVHSPSAEVRGHGKPVLQTGKKGVAITDLTFVGHYAVKLTFDDGHDTGLYSWPYLLELCQQHDEKWAAYLDAIHQANATREADTTVVKFVPR